MAAPIRRASAVSVVGPAAAARVETELKRVFSPEEFRAQFSRVLSGDARPADTYEPKA